MSPRRSESYCKDRVNPYPFYSPRFWAGMRFLDYAGLLARNRFRIHPTRIPMALAVGGCAASSSLLSVIQNVLMNRKIAATELQQPPVFVIGHWRSGTTLLHEMLCLDQQFSWPSTFECFVPTHHLVSRPLLRPLIRLLMPGKRPMDKMPAGPDLPQEDEFALMGLGVPTPYYRIAFCNEPARFVEMLNLQEATERQRQDLREGLTWFYKSVVLNNPGRLVLKSPTHTGRIGFLAKWFPGAKFVHITRNPHKVFPSTMHLWNSLASVQGYQIPKADQSATVDYVNTCYQQMYSGFFDQVSQIPAEDLVHIRFEDLVRNPFDQVRSVYEAFDLPGFDEMKIRLEGFWGQRSSHRTNQTQLDDATRSMIDDVWSDYIEAFGYSRSGTSQAMPAVAQN